MSDVRKQSATSLLWPLTRPDLDRTGVRMNWNDLTQNWAASYTALCNEFPNLEPSAMPFLKADQERFESYLAATHDMSLKEAQDAFDAYLTRQTSTERHTA